MKKIYVISLTLILFLLAVFVVSAEPNSQPNTGNINSNQGSGSNVASGNGQGLNENPGNANNPNNQGIMQQAQNNGQEQQIMIQQRIGLTEEQKESIKSKIQLRQNELEQELQKANSKQKEVLKNQNKVRLAVHTLLELENMGGIGKNISAIAREFNNSVQSTIRAEERIMTKSAFARFFTGGDEKAAAELESEVLRNQERILKLKQLRDQCECDEETKALIQEQTRLMEQEQERLKELSQQAKKSKGILGWIWK
ncbi:MAG: hypothetical protein QXK76_03600 [Candidatus Woesearchaeota archaeon]